MPLTALEERVRRAVEARRDVLLLDLRRHVGTPTGPRRGLPNVAGLDETRGMLCARLEALGAKTRLVPGDPRPGWLEVGGGDEAGSVGVVPPTVLCERVNAGGGGGDGGASRSPRRVLLSGHLDTVHDAEGAFAELTVSADGKTARGPGCVDMKGGLVIAVHALEVLEECGVGCAWSFVMNSDEETGSFHSARALEEAAAGHDFGLALEPAMAGGELAVSRGGSGQFAIDAKGKAAHVGRDFASGVSAVEALARAVVGAHGLSRVKEGVCVNVGPLWCPTPTNVVAPHARAWGNVRYPDGAAAEGLRAGLLGLERGAREGELPRVRVESSFNRPAKPATAAVQALALAARGVAEGLGQRLPFAHSGGVCDGNNLQAAGLATIDTLGVRGGGLHTGEEWIELASLTERCALLAVLVSRLCAGGAGGVGEAEACR
jgi:glutamate carboxypeptidase